MNDCAADSRSWAEYRASGYWTGLRLDETAANAVARRHDLRVITAHRTETLAEVLSRAHAIAAELGDHGLAPGGRIVLQVTAGTADDFGLLLALSTLDSRVFLSPPGASTRELELIVRRSGATTVIATGAQIRDLASEAEFGEVQMVEVEVDTARISWTRRSASPPTRLAASSAHLASPTRFVTFTSGTTGEPKGVQHGYDTLAYAGDQLLRCSEPADGPVAGLLSLTHASGLAFSLYSALSHARDLVLYQGKWSGDGAYNLIRESGATWTVGTPTHLHDLTDSAERSSRRHPFTMCIGGARVSPTSVERADQLGITVCRIFGLSECLGHTTTSARSTLEVRMYSEGRPFPGTDLVAFEPDGSRAAPGIVGEAGCRGPSLFLGYLGQDSLAESLSQTGFFMTGDLIEFQDDGSVIVTGRLKDIVIRGGENIDVNEVEVSLSDMPGVAAVVALGVPDSRLGERLGVVLEVPDGRPIDVFGVAAFQDSRVRGYHNRVPPKLGEQDRSTSRQRDPIEESCR